jgi:hypothetical protein
VANERRREDCRAVVELMREATGEEPRLWGSSIIGFGRYHDRYESGREGDWFLTGVSPRKPNPTLDIMPGFANHEELLAKLGKHETGKACVYINRLTDMDLDMLRQMIQRSVAHRIPSGMS